MKLLKLLLCTTFIFATSFIFGCSSNGNDIRFFKKDGKYSIESDSMKIEFDNQMKCNIYRKQGEELFSIIGKGDVPHYIVVNGVKVKNFTVDDEKIELLDIDNNIGTGKRLILKGTADGPSGSLIEKTLSVDVYENFPQAGLITVQYRNLRSTPGLVIEKEVDNSFRLDASLINKNYGRHAFWILQGGSYKARPDWILPVTDDFSFENYQGQRIEEAEFGGGLPVLDVWCKETGFFIGSVREKPTLISLPARVDEDGLLDISIQYRRDVRFENPYTSIPVIVGVHSGDYYNGLRTYSKIMQRKGFKMLEPEPSDPVYDPVWCGWGYGPNFRPQKMIEMIPLLKELGFKVVTVDLGWFYANGDFLLRDDMFPNGDEDMKKFVQTFHDNGLLMKIWTTPCVAGPVLQKEHPEWLLKDVNGEYVKYDSYGSRVAYLCPALKEVQDYHRELYRKIIEDWGYDGLKLDLGLINSIKKCYAKEHHHQYPEESLEALPKLYEIISDETRRLKPHAIIELCPCGLFPSFYKMPYYNQPVASDPNTQWQIRHRGKTFKALMGPHTAYYGDHVERYYKESNFASMIGVGGIPGSMFVDKAENRFPHSSRSVRSIALTPERKEHFKKWLDIYRTFQLAKGEYLNLYDIAYDKPEAHVIRKDNILYYAFYAPEWNGEVEFRGLDANKYYIIEDYVHHKKLGKIKGGGKLDLSFKEYLLVKAVPEK